jgi:hypothetical protein
MGMVLPGKADNLRSMQRNELKSTGARFTA